MTKLVALLKADRLKLRSGSARILLGGRGSEVSSHKHRERPSVQLRWFPCCGFILHRQLRFPEPLAAWFNKGRPKLNLPQASEIVTAFRRMGMVGAEHPLVDRQCALEE